MAAELQKLAKQLDIKGFEIASSSINELTSDLVKNGLIPNSLNGEAIEVFPGDSFGDIVKGYRQELGLSQTALSKKAGLNHTSISRIESGKSKPTLSAAFKISNGLGLTHKQEDDLIHAARVHSLKSE